MISCGFIAFRFMIIYTQLGDGDSQFESDMCMELP